MSLDDLRRLHNKCSGVCGRCGSTEEMWRAWNLYGLRYLPSDVENRPFSPLSYRGLVGPVDMSPLCFYCATLLVGNIPHGNNSVTCLPGDPRAAIVAMREYLGYGDSQLLALAAAMLGRGVNDYVTHFVEALADMKIGSITWYARSYAPTHTLREMVKKLENCWWVYNQGVLGYDSLVKIASILHIPLNEKHFNKARRCELCDTTRKRLIAAPDFGIWMLSLLLRLSGTRVCAINTGAVAEILAALGLAELRDGEDPSHLANSLITLAYERLQNYPKCHTRSIYAPPGASIEERLGIVARCNPVKRVDLIPYSPSLNNYEHDDDGRLFVTDIYHPNGGLTVRRWVIKQSRVDRREYDGLGNIQYMIRRALSGPISPADLTREWVVKIARRTRSAVPNIAQIVAAYLLLWYRWRVDTGTNRDSLALTKAADILEREKTYVEPHIYTVNDLDQELYATLGAPLTFAEVYGDYADYSACAVSAASGAPIAGAEPSSAANL